MKRKLNENNEPVLVSGTNKKKSDTEVSSAVANATPSSEAASSSSFADLGLDPRLLQAVAQQSFQKPTLVQSKAIPLALEGRDVLAKAKTGSGKTAAYVLPILQAVLKRKQINPGATYISSLILVPTRELTVQVTKEVERFSAFCAKEVQVVGLTDKVSDAVQRSLLQSSSPDIVVSTPSTAWRNVDSGALSLDKLTHLVLDEADLVLSYGYDEDLEKVARGLPKGVQTVMTSATLTDEIDTLKGIFLRDPVLLDLEEPDAEGSEITQYIVKCGEDEKFLLAYILFKLQLIKGKVIIFVADVDRCYRLKLFFEQFGIRSCILNSELPVNSRISVVEEFNRNVYDIIIASDENEMMGDEDRPAPNGDGKEEAEVDKKHENEDEGQDGEASKAAPRPKKKRKMDRKRDKQYGVSRGIDFKNVAVVVNFDLPLSSTSYTHRIGRTGRAGQAGMVLSFYVPKELFRKHIPTSIDSAENDEKVLARVIKQQKKLGREIKPYNFDRDQVESFRYRMNDALRAVTKIAVREARTRELRQELLKSEKLKRHFEENPAELQHLVRHDGELRTARANPELRHVPDYLLPKEGRKGLSAAEIGFVPLRKSSDRQKKGRFFKKGGARSFKAGGRKSDPLKTFKAKRKTK
ncbi:ATP-dependent DNA/RNA helicase [Pyricularia oryzae]|uniref:RNA helicase n=2 Tax=Pyricularia TaxID=48558 RepID=A0ABQ8NDT8_PYRGI|nr:ATP-dependent DNA/RNA helicase [Pyricularia oryzae]KAI6294610.1 ATP-dependent DNA/RNA helicase [Pyricularia grisea]KAI6263316.1 ATP-dependent DNA/RNA helicase [Pyricularia oryzae]KAI6267645.1 ATP-dependent DNA/RNA helicase [Pyricularia oryzae]KAI6277124.1 ATP-dependent DNA/RNA helicase [Pyricularia oryzae]